MCVRRGWILLKACIQSAACYGEVWSRTHFAEWSLTLGNSVGEDPRNGSATTTEQRKAVLAKTCATMRSDGEHRQFSLGRCLICVTLRNSDQLSQLDDPGLLG
ncbi:hypothetical protein K523DRAFT_69390 [Schizophyllum commune Tattone D]|nr:hypothetical protein K523DRAFT_69390 [Schizophyllum commune Tattone D]